MTQRLTLCFDICGHNHWLTAAYPCKWTTQRATIQGLKQLCAAYGTLDVIESEQGHFTGHQVQQWAEALNIDWRFHLPYTPLEVSLKGTMAP